MKNFLIVDNDIVFRLLIIILIISFSSQVCRMKNLTYKNDEIEKDQSSNSFYYEYIRILLDQN